MEVQYQELQELINKDLADDPLFEQIKQRKEQYEELTSKYFLSELDTKKWYSTVETADMFNISDSKLRYYIKPFFNYILPKDTPSSNSAYRLNYLSIIKLRMILMLKDEFKVAGIETLIGLRGSVVQTSKEKGLDSRGQTQRVEQLEHMLSEIMKTGLFQFVPSEDGETNKLEINSEVIQNQFLLPLNEHNEEISQIQQEMSSLKEILEKEVKEKEKLREELKRLDQREDIIAQVDELKSKLETESEEKENLRKEIEKLDQRDDIAARFKENQKLSKLRLEASQEWDKKNKGLKRLFASEYAKQLFIDEYIQKNTRINE